MTPNLDTRRPRVSILNPAFRYKPSHATDVRETFERVRRELDRARGREVLPTLSLSRQSGPT